MRFVDLYWEQTHLLLSGALPVLTTDVKHSSAMKNESFNFGKQRQKAGYFSARRKGFIITNTNNEVQNLKKRNN